MLKLSYYWIDSISNRWSGSYEDNKNENEEDKMKKEIGEKA